MLILSRNVGQRIYIGEDLTITVVQIQSGQVKIGIEAPNEIPVHREEIYFKIKKLNELNRHD